MDAGNYFKPLGPGSDLINQLMLESLNSLAVRVLNLAPEDLFFWNALSKAQLRSTQVISSNLAPRDHTVRAPATHAIVEVPGASLDITKNVRVGFLGLTNPEKVKPNSGFTAADPEAAVARIKAQIKNQTDFLIVLADMPRATATRLALRHPEIQAIILAEKQFIFHPPEQVNKAVILSSVERGRYLGQLALQLDSSGRVTVQSPDVVELKAGIPEDPQLLRRQMEIGAKLPANAH